MKTKIAIATLALLVLPTFALAANSCGGIGSNIGQCVSQIYIWAIGAAGILALVMTVLGGYMVMSAAGNAERASRGKSYITSSLIGLVLLFGAYLILNTINPDLTNFNFDLNKSATPPTTNTSTTNTSTTVPTTTIDPGK